MRSREIREDVNNKLEEAGQTPEDLTTDKLKAWTDRIEFETDRKIAEVEKKEALAREHQDRMRKPFKKPNIEKEFNKASIKIMNERREADKDKELQDKIDDKDLKKEAAKKEKKIEKKIKKLDKKANKK